MAKNAQEYIRETFKRVGKHDNDKVVGKDDLTIWGGNFEADQLDAFLQQWSGFTWCFLESVSAFAVQKAPHTYGDVEHVERLRLFDKAGDLDIRRDGNRFYWRFIGIGGRQPLNPPFAKVDDFWASYPSQQFLRIDRRYYQWRKGDERVGLDLSKYFPNLKGGAADPAIYLKQIHYLDQGNIAFVRYVDLVEV